MIVRDFYIQRITVLETKAYAPLVVDAHVPLSSAVAFQCFEPIARRGAHLLYDQRQVKLHQLAQCRSFNIREAGDTLAVEQRFGLDINVTR